jgi:hypothetical protein
MSSKKRNAAEDAANEMRESRRQRNASKPMGEVLQSLRAKSGQSLHQVINNLRLLQKDAPVKSRDNISQATTALEFASQGDTRQATIDILVMSGMNESDAIALVDTLYG